VRRLAWLDNSRRGEHTPQVSARSIAVGIAAIAAVIAGCTNTQNAATSTQAPAPATSPIPADSTIDTSSSTSSSTSVLPSTPTPTPTPEVITRPYVDPTRCGPGAKAEFNSQNVTWVPFAVAPPQTVPLQVFASDTNGIAKPFAVVLRLAGTSSDRNNDHPVLINGAQVSITIWPNGNQQAAWTLPDGIWAYLRARDLDEASLVALITRLIPREPSAPIPGFDLAPSTAPDDLILLHEHLNSGLSGTVTRFQCATEPNQGIFHVDVVQGDPVFVYFGVLDRPRPYAVGANGNGAITIDASLGSTALTLDDIINADPATWEALPAIGPFGTQLPARN